MPSTRRSTRVWAVRIGRQELSVSATLRELRGTRGQLNRKYDQDDKHHIVRMVETMMFRQHLCFVFEIMSINLYELLKARPCARARRCVAAGHLCGRVVQATTALTGTLPP